MNLKIEKFTTENKEDNNLYNILSKMMQFLSEAKIYPFESANYFDGKDVSQIQTIMKILRNICFNMSHPKRSFAALENISLIKNNQEIYNELKKK